MKYSFGPFEADTASRELRKNGVTLKLGEQPFKVLTALLERAGEDIGREDLRRRLWPEGTYVDFDKGLNSVVNKLRETLADSADQPRYIETIPKRGYRFVARLETEARPAALEKPSTGAGRLPATASWKRRRIAIAAAVLVALAGSAATGVILRRDPPLPVRSLLILPFQSANSADSDYLGRGITEQVTARLAALPGLRLISPAAANNVALEGLSPQEAGKRFHVEAVLIGSVRRTERKIRVNAQMIRSGNGDVLWAEGGLDVEGGDLLEAERLLATTIAARLRPSLTHSEQNAVTRSPTSSAEAYELFVRAKLVMRKKPQREDELLVAEKLLREATTIDKGFAEAHAWLGIVQYAKFSFGFAGEATKRKSIENARKALAIDPSVAAARRALIDIFHSTGQAEEGLREAALLRQSGASDADSLVAMALAYLRGGMPDRAVPLFQQALDLDPEDEELRGRLAFAATWTRQYDLSLQVTASSTRQSFHRMLAAMGARRDEVARAAAIEAMRTADAFTLAMCWLNLNGLGEHEAQRQLWRMRSAEIEANAASLRNERVRIGLALIYASLGDIRKAVEYVRLALEANPGDPWTLFWSAEVYGLMGDDRRALEGLQQAVDRGFLCGYCFDFELEYGGRGLYRYRDDPRFRAVRDRLQAKVQLLRERY